MSDLPRVVVAAPASAHGKTTVATGLMAALTRRGMRVSGHKVGPDYIDPGYHALATGRPGRNLDAHLVGPQRVAPLLLHGARTPVPAQVAVVEGAMGLFDGAVGREGFASTAHVARLLDAPVLLVVDVARASRTVAAVVHGLRTFDTRVRVGGVVLNRVGSPRHEAEVRDALSVTGVPVLGALPRDAGLELPSRHLGLVPAAEHDDAATVLDRLAAQVARHVDLDAVLRLARSAPPCPAVPWDPAAEVGEPVAGRPVVALAAGPAFTFRYPETAELLTAAGCEVVDVDPLTDVALPAGARALHLGGGFPQVHADRLAGNTALRAAVADAVRAGMPTVAECAGLLYLAQSLDGAPMAGVLPARAAMTPRLTLGYRTARAPAATLLTGPGEPVTAHEHHRTAVEIAPGTPPAWELDGRVEGMSLDPARLGRPTVHASYLHVHWAGHPRLAARFARAAAGPGTARPSPARAATPPVEPAPPVEPVETTPDLTHHGDRELGPGLVDLAVNVRADPWPLWLREALTDGLAQARAYPRTEAAVAAVAARHGRRPVQVLLTAGAAEAFTLLARARPWRHPVVVHPQFTEPEAALAAAGHRVHRVLLTPDDGFRLDARRVPDEADLVVVGNPTNPTGVLHPREELLRLVRPGRLVVVDEAFLDAVPGEPESLAGSARPGLAVIRSLTKTWAVPGIRAGYVLAEPALVADLARQQPPWSVSTPALALLQAASDPRASAESARRAQEGAAERDRLAAALAAAGLEVVDGWAPFVLARGPSGLRECLREKGFAVRRGDTFPGLSNAWVRLAVRDTTTTDAVARAVAGALTALEAGTVRS